jgi:hypothetical protein
VPGGQAGWRWFRAWLVGERDGGHLCGRILVSLDRTRGRLRSACAHSGSPTDMDFQAVARRGKEIDLGATSGRRAVMARTGEAR